ncbi:transcription antitermination factor NusB [Pinisolibacter sp.]|uniref:transcription antitermination factor NusB n=1 Tax=Pinisolibacter sp. TaxID=2172024 RepID=UPI002FDF05DF
MTDTKPAAPRDVKPANKRGAARLAAVQALYQMEIAGTELGDVVAEFENFRLGREIDGDTYREADPEFFREIVAGVVAYQRDIDPRVDTTLVEGWPLKRIDVTLREILRAGSFELLKRKDIPARVVIAEYVDVAKAFFGEDEPRIVNAVLDKIARTLRTTEFEG